MELVYLILPIVGAFLLLFIVCCCGKKVKELFHIPKEVVTGGYRIAATHDRDLEATPQPGPSQVPLVALPRPESDSFEDITISEITEPSSSGLSRTGQLQSERDSGVYSVCDSNVVPGPSTGQPSTSYSRQRLQSSDSQRVELEQRQRWKSGGESQRADEQRRRWKSGECAHAQKQRWMSGESQSFEEHRRRWKSGEPRPEDSGACIISVRSRTCSGDTSNTDPVFEPEYEVEGAGICILHVSPADVAEVDSKSTISQVDTGSTNSNQEKD